MKHYRTIAWNSYREEIIEADGGCCTQCGRGREDGVVLQVHHKRYIKGRMPWEYAFSDCETLCKGCHAIEHGLIPPREGWELIGDDDLGDLVGECELCGTAIRYVFLVQHENWPALEVGTVCCDHLTGNDEASKYMKGIKSHEKRLETFINSKRWREIGKNAIMNTMKTEIHIVSYGNCFRIIVGNKAGKLEFPTMLQAKRKLFDLRETGQLERYLRTVRARSNTA